MLDETTALMLIETETSLNQRRNKSLVCVSFSHFVQNLTKQSSMLLDKKSNYQKHPLEIPKYGYKKKKF